MLHVALYQPVIPQNTGAIARTCIGFNAALHLIGPLGFDVSDAAAKRAGLDYWPNLILHPHADPDAFLSWLGPREPWLVTKFGPTRYDHAAYGEEDVLVLGNENHGLPASWRERWPRRCVHIPVLGAVRSFNLSCSAAIVLAEALRQTGAFDAGQHRPMPG